MELALAFPAALWALLGLPLLVLFNWLAGRPRDLVVPNLMLWRRLASQIERSRSRSRLRWLELLLELGLLALLAIGAARPHLRQTVHGARRIAIVLDDSAAMQTRFAWQRATAQAGRLLDRLDAGDRVALRLVVQGPGSDWSTPDQARRLLATARPAGRHAGAEPVVRAALAADPRATVYWIGLGPPREPADARLVRIGVGEPTSDNLGWVGFDAQQEQQGFTVMGLLASASAQAQRRIVRLESDGRVLARRTVEVGPLASVELRFGPGLALGRRVTLALEGGDSLALDDRVSARLGQPVRLAVRPQGALPELELVRRLLPEVSSDAPAERTLHVLLGGRPPDPLPLPCVLVAPESGGPWRIGPAPAPGAFGRLGGTALLAGLDLSAVRIRRALRIEAAPRALRALAWSAEGDTPLLLRSGKLLLLAFRPARPDSNWTEDPSFPIFWRRAIHEAFPDARLSASWPGRAVTDNRGWRGPAKPGVPPPAQARRTRDISPLCALLAAVFLLAYAAARGKTMQAR